jgi:hypothetical protein
VKNEWEGCGNEVEVTGFKTLSHHKSRESEQLACRPRINLPNTEQMQRSVPYLAF